MVLRLRAHGLRLRVWVQGFRVGFRGPGLGLVH